VKRHPSLHPLSEHHHHALVRALEIRRAKQVPTARRPAALRQTAREFLRFWKKTGQKHFREEEELLLPAYARHSRLEQEPAVARMLADHATIRASVEDLKATLAARQPVDALLTALGQLLHDHVRLEENEIFPRIERALPEVELRCLGVRLTRLHRKKQVAARRTR
jgi:hemerythrin-like domain-containing protein